MNFKLLTIFIIALMSITPIAAANQEVAYQSLGSLIKDNNKIGGTVNFNNTKNKTALSNSSSKIRKFNPVNGSLNKPVHVNGENVTYNNELIGFLYMVPISELNDTYIGCVAIIHEDVANCTGNETKAMEIISVSPQVSITLKDNHDQITVVDWFKFRSEYNEIIIKPKTNDINLIKLIMSLYDSNIVPNPIPETPWYDTTLKGIGGASGVLGISTAIYKLVKNLKTRYWVTDPNGRVTEASPLLRGQRPGTPSDGNGIQDPVRIGPVREPLPVEHAPIVTISSNYRPYTADIYSDF